MNTRVAVIADDRNFRACVEAAVQSDHTCVGLGFSSHPSARMAVRAAEPDVILVDYEIVDALGVCTELSTVAGSGVIVIAVPDETGAAVDALSAGARGVIFKTQAIGDVPKAVDIVRIGKVWAPRDVVVATWMRLKSAVERTRAADDVEPEIVARLSHREREVLRHTAVGLGNKEVAALLAISEATVKVHLTHIFQKLGLRSRGELAAAYFGHHPNVVRRIAN